MTKNTRPPIKTYTVIARVKSVHGLNGEDTGGKGPCRFYKPGDKLYFRDDKIEGQPCYSAIATFMHKIVPMRVGLNFPWVKEGIAEHICPDAARPVVFEIFREEDNPYTDE